LDVEYQNRRALSFVSFAWQAGVLVVFWFARKWSTGVRGALAVLGLIGPLALVSLVPIDVLPYLDGLFLGTVWGLALWLVLAIIAKLQKLRSTSNSIVRFNICSNNARSATYAPLQGDIFIGTWDGGTLDGIQIYNNTANWSPAADGGWIRGRNVAKTGTLPTFTQHYSHRANRADSFRLRP
jgi:hypothetical protein